MDSAMRRTRRQALFLVLAALAAPTMAAADTPDIAVGQEWSVKDTIAKVVIGRIETLGRFEAVSFSIDDAPTDRGPATFAHIPFEKAALIASLDRLLATGAATDANFEAGYQLWKSAKGGVYTLSVAQVIAAILSMLPRGLRSAPPST